MQLATRHGSLALDRYESRIAYFRELCRGKRVLHLGCSSSSFIHDRIQRGSLLHAILHEEAKELHGIDLDEESMVVMREKFGFKNLYQADAERLGELQLSEAFDVVLAGDLIEHLSRPGDMLEGVKRFLSPHGRLVVSTVNAFGLHFQLRRWLGSYAEHPQHVCFYSPETMVHVLERHGYRVQEMRGSYTEPPKGLIRKIEFAVGSPVFKAMPGLAGTLIAVASLDTH